MSKIEDKIYVCRLCLVCELFLNPSKNLLKRMACFKNVNQKNNSIADIILGQYFDL